MIVAVALFEIHIVQARSLKEKRGVVRSLRERIRNRFGVSAAEVGLNDLHQRARIGVAMVTSERDTAEGMMAALLKLVEEEREATLVGWTSEFLDFDQNVALGVPGFDGPLNFGDRDEEES